MLLIGRWRDGNALILLLGSREVALEGTPWVLALLGSRVGEGSIASGLGAEGIGECIGLEKQTRLISIEITKILSLTDINSKNAYFDQKTRIRQKYTKNAELLTPKAKRVWAFNLGVIWAKPPFDGSSCAAAGVNRENMLASPVAPSKADLPVAGVFSEIPPKYEAAVDLVLSREGDSSGVQANLLVSFTGTKACS